MIKITKESSRKRIKIQFARTTASNRLVGHIEVRPKNKEYEEEAAINIAATGDLYPQDIPEFLEAVRLAEMIASGKLVIK